jgi:hypothetical protein
MSICLEHWAAYAKSQLDACNKRTRQKEARTVGYFSLLRYVNGSSSGSCNLSYPEGLAMLGAVVTDEEIEAVAEELAKVGGLSWYPGRTRGALLRPVTERYRDRAKVAIAALDRLRAKNNDGFEQQTTLGSAALLSREGLPKGPDEPIQVGSIVVYRPPGDQRAITCRIDQLEQGRAYLVPCARPDVGWVSLDNLQPLHTESADKEE